MKWLSDDCPMTLTSSGHVVTDYVVASKNKKYPVQHSTGYEKEYIVWLGPEKSVEATTKEEIEAAIVEHEKDA